MQGSWIRKRFLATEFNSPEEGRDQEYSKYKGQLASIEEKNLHSPPIIQLHIYLILFNILGLSDLRCQGVLSKQWVRYCSLSLSPSNQGIDNDLRCNSRQCTSEGQVLRLPGKMIASWGKEICRPSLLLTKTIQSKVSQPETTRRTKISW